MNRHERRAQAKRNFVAKCAMCEAETCKCCVLPNGVRAIASLLGTSHANVINIEKRALKKMREAAMKEGLDGVFDCLLNEGDDGKEGHG